jgi:hypothetical protein
LRLGAFAGLVAAAATAGVLIGFGLARGAPALVINTAAHVAVGSRALHLPRTDLLVTPLALVLHVVFVSAWGVLFALLAAPLRGGRLLAAAGAFVAAIAAADLWLFPARLRPGFETILGTNELLTVYAVLWLALVAGMRAARPTAPALRMLPVPHEASDPPVESEASDAAGAPESRSEAWPGTRD